MSFSVHRHGGAPTPGEEMHTLLTETTRLLGADLDCHQMLSRIADLTSSSFADLCAIETVDAEGRFTQVAVAHRDPAKLELVRRIQRRYPPQPGRPNVPVRVLDTGLSELLPTVSDAALAEVAQDAEHLRMLRELRTTSLIVVPLETRGKVLGTLLLANAEPGRRFGLPDLRVAEDLGKRVALAIANSMLLESEREARAAAERAVERTVQLQSLAAQLAEALTPAQVAEVVVTQGIASVGADAGALQLLTADGKWLQVVCGLGSDRSLIEEEWASVSVDLKLPSTDALHRLAPVFIESEQDISAKYPGMETTRRTRRARSGAHIPLVLPGGPLGVLFLGFSRPRTFSTSQRSFVLALGRQCAQALKRAQLYEAELTGRSGLSRLVERLHEGVFSVDRHGRVEFASTKAKEMLNSASLEEGRLVPEAWLGFPLRRFITGLFAAEETTVEAQVADEDGTRVFDVTGIPGAHTDAALVVVTDVSERERRWRAEREFVDNAAHELRTPLAAITSAIDRLQSGARDVPEKRDRFLGHIQQESARLNRLASSLLMLARVQTREEAPRRDELALRGLLQDLFVGLEVNPGVEVVFDCPPDLVIWSNRDLLEHALLNLASNAARHTRCGSIRVSARVEADSSVTIELGDTGSGIRPEELDRLFDRFYRGPTEERRSGFGLGLPITKDSVEALGGRIELDSVLGAGTIARIVLPAHRVPT